jgi:formate dehydrogenase iron-sulfur subunit
MEKFMEIKKMPKISRRSFLKTSAGVAALPGLVLPNVAQAKSEKRLATLIDLSLCDGCSDRVMPACVSICKEINKDRIPKFAEPIPMPWPRKIIEDWSEKREVFDRLTPYNFIYVHKVYIELNGQKKTLFVPRRCMHCDNPACATICPFSANHKQQNGAVVINQNLCFGGAKCRTVCPWEIPQRQSGVGIYLHVLPTLMGNGVMYKCDLCSDRLGEGKLPGCVEACPGKALLIGAKKNIEALAEERMKQMNGYIYGKKENGGTSTLYVSPVSFDLINGTMKKKPGQPDMPPGVERRMAGTDNLGKAVLATPALGVAVGIAGAFKWLSRRKADVKKGQEKDNG